VDISERIARIIGFQQIQLAEKEAIIEALQAQLRDLHEPKAPACDPNVSVRDCLAHSPKA